VSPWIHPVSWSNSPGFTGKAQINLDFAALSLYRFLYNINDTEANLQHHNSSHTLPSSWKSSLIVQAVKQLPCLCASPFFLPIQEGIAGP